MHTFEDLGIAAALLPVLAELGYETPSPVQQQAIPVILQGKDILAQAQTGTGKTAAFALPILSNLVLERMKPQAIILTPTRELAIQVAESFKSYAKYLPNFHVLPIYGGQDYRPQLRALERGVHVIVGTPGRVMDHLRRGSLSLADLKTLVLDEADEMLNMGFLDDVKWILEQIPGPHQTALFSATIPNSIRAIVDNYLKDATHLQLTPKQAAVSTIEQCYLSVSRANKLEALTRFLELEDIDGMIIFTRTKTASAEIAEKLEARGFAAAAINGDMKQDARERVIKRIKNGSLDIIVATEVAARGLDVERVSHVVNYDIPLDPESYLHRIGRTGRAGRVGKAILFVEPREGRLLRDIERMIKQPLTQLYPPSVAQLTEKRASNFIKQVLDALNNDQMDTYRNLVNEMAQTSSSSLLDIAAALAYLVQKDKRKPVFDESMNEMARESQSDRGSNRNYEKRPFKGNSSEGRKRSSDKDRKFSNTGSGSKPKRDSNGTSKPRRSSEGEFKPRRSSEGEFKPRRSSEGESKPRRSEGEFKPRRSSEGEFKPRRSEGEFKPRRSGEGESKPRRSEGEFKPRRSSEGASKPRRSEGEFKPRRADDSRPKRDGDSKSPQSKGKRTLSFDKTKTAKSKPSSFKSAPSKPAGNKIRKKK